MFKITKIVPVSNLGNTPARVHRPTGTVFINNNIWNELSLPEQKIILLHEEGHYVLQTKNEKEADYYAFKHYAGTEPYSLKNTLLTLYNNLDINNNPAHLQRFNSLLKIVLWYDFSNYGNKKALNYLLKTNKMEEISNNSISNVTSNLLIDFLRQKGIKNISALNLPEREALLTEFMKTPQVQYVITRKAQSELPGYNGSENEEYDEWGEKLKAGIKNLTTKVVDFGAKVGDVTAKATGIVGANIMTGLGIPVNKETIEKITKAVNPFIIADKLIDKKNDKEKEKAEEKAEANQQIAQQIASETQNKNFQAETPVAKNNNKKWYVIAAILVLTIGVGLYFAFRNK